MSQKYEMVSQKYEMMSYICDMELLAPYKITDAAIAVLYEDPSATLDAIADRAAVTRRTLHRYFKDRQALITACENNMREQCRAAIEAALLSSDDELKQLENMLYASITCGSKYSFWQKIHQHTGHAHTSKNEKCAQYDNTFAVFEQIIINLMEKGKLPGRLPVNWIFLFFNSVIETSINMQKLYHTTPDDVKQYAWHSFKRGIGIW